MRHQVWWGSVIFLQLCFGWPAAALSSETIQKIEFLSFEQVQPMLQAMSGKIPKGLSGSGEV
jgi:hypothetical protein